MCSLHLYRLHFGFLAFRIITMQAFRMRKGRFNRCFRFHADCSFSGQILRHRGSYAKITRHRYMITAS